LIENTSASYIAVNFSTRVLNSRLARQRLENQLLTRAGGREAADVVAWFGAMQAQEYAFAKWAIALRLRQDTPDIAIGRAFDEGRILRTHVMRPTWHFVTPADIRWLLELTGPRVQRANATYNTRLELDRATLVKGTAVIERALGGERFLTRRELGERLQRAGLTMTPQRLGQMAMHAEQEAVICSGPRRDRQFTYALVAERAPGAKRLSRDEALGELARRYFRSHAPATIRDFVWWSGLMTADARRAIEIARARSQALDGRTYWSMLPGTRRAAPRRRRVHLLPIYDEYLVAYRDRGVGASPPTPGASPARSMIFQHTLAIGGQVAGAWRVVRNGDEVSVVVDAHRRLTAAERKAIADAVRGYERFLGNR
jgi:hypothetical protein